MNWIMMAAVALLFVVNLVACGRSEAPTPTTQPVSISSAKETELAIDADRRQIKEERKRHDEERRQQIVDEIRQAFDLVKEPERRDISGQKQPLWVKELTAASSARAKTCANSEKFDEMTRAFGYLTPGREVITLEEISVNVDTIQEMVRRYRKLGLTVASSFVEVFQMPRPARTKAQCGRGEGSFTFEDTSRVMRVIVNALAETNETPKAIKQTPTTLRAMLLKDFVERLADIRKDIEEGRASKSDGMGNFLYISREAVDEWKFSHEELKLTKQEVVAYGDYRKR